MPHQDLQSPLVVLEIKSKQYLPPLSFHISTFFLNSQSLPSGGSVWMYFPFLYLFTVAYQVPLYKQMPNLDERLWRLFLPGENKRRGLGRKGIKGSGEKEDPFYWGRLLPTFLGDQGHLTCTALTFLPLPWRLRIITIHPSSLPRVPKEDIFCFFAKVHPSTWTIDPILSHLF